MKRVQPPGSGSSCQVSSSSDEMWVVPTSELGALYLNEQRNIRRKDCIENRERKILLCVTQACSSLFPGVCLAQGYAAGCLHGAYLSQKWPESKLMIQDIILDQDEHNLRLAF